MICEDCKQEIDTKKGGLVFKFTVEEDNEDHYVCQPCLLKSMKEAAAKAKAKEDK